MCRDVALAWILTGIFGDLRLVAGCWLGTGIFQSYCKQRFFLIFHGGRPL